MSSDLIIIALDVFANVDENGDDFISKIEEEKTGRKWSDVAVYDLNNTYIFIPEVRIRNIVIMRMELSTFNCICLVSSWVRRIFPWFHPYSQLLKVLITDQIRLFRTNDFKSVLFLLYRRILKVTALEIVTVKGCDWYI